MNPAHSIALLLLAIAACLALPLPREPVLSDVDGESTVTISDGTVDGVVYDRARAFFAIPYAAPPTGDNRWEPPSAPASWSSPLDATKYGPGCPQICELPPLTCPLGGVSEACLNLDVYTPRAAEITSPRPVMVFYYGGNYKQGASSTPLYSGVELANSTEVIVVVINYRVGALSFFINDDVHGNLATQDQTFALQWVQKNIAAFGGDPTQVTIFGQSAGGSSVACHMVSPAAKGLFHAAIMESNPIQLTLKTPLAMRRLSDRFAELLNCSRNDLQCLRSKNTSEILQAQNDAIKVDILAPLQAFMPWQPYVDGKVITAQPMDAFRSGDYNQVPFMLGNVNDEGIMFIDEAFPDAFPKADYLALLAVVFRTNAGKVYDMYPVPTGMENDTRTVLATLGTDYIWACPQRNLSRYMSQNEQPVYYYRFDHVLPYPIVWGPNYTECTEYCCHASELPFVFNSAQFLWSSDEAKLATQVSTNWANFATSFDPNSPITTATQWQAFSESNDLIMHYQAPDSSMESGYRKEYCDFWDTIGYEWGN